jgi:hypothetical protein
MALEIACEEDVLSIVTQVRIPSLINSYVNVRRSSVRVQRSSVRVRLDQLGCGVAQLVVRCAVREARVRFSARHLREVFSTELASDKEMERNLGE